MAGGALGGRPLLDILMVPGGPKLVFYLLLLQIYRDFCDFQHGGCRHLEFSKILNFNGVSAVGGQYASSCQISPKSVKRLQTYGDLTVFKMAADRHLGFVKFEIFNCRSG